MNGGSDFKWATDVDERNLLWKTRHDILYACMALRPGCKVSFSINPCMHSTVICTACAHIYLECITIWYIKVIEVNFIEFLCEF